MVTYLICKVCFVVIIILTFNSTTNAQIRSFYQNPIEKFTKGVKKIIHKAVFDGEMKITVYEYDKYNRISKQIEYHGNSTTTANRFTIYNYNSEQNYKEKITYKRRELYPYDYDTCLIIKYTYENRLLVSETALNFDFGISSEIVYKYENGRMILKCFYVNDSLQSRSAFKYNKDRIVHEVNETVGNTLQDTVKYVYSGDTLTGVMFLRGFPNGNFKYTYNIIGQVIKSVYRNTQMYCTSYVDTFEY